MFKQGDVAYFVFRGDFNTGRYKNFYCLPTYFNYFPFRPIKIVNTSGIINSLNTCLIDMGEHLSWIMPIDLLEKEFVFDKFVLAKLEWGGEVSQSQFRSIMATL